MDGKPIMATGRTGVLIQIKEMTPALNMTNGEIVLIALLTFVCTVGLFVGAARAWAFPVPFGLVFICPPYTVMLIAFFLLVMGRKRFRQNPSLVRELQDLSGIVAVQSSLCLVYPAFDAIYNSLPSHHRSLFPVML